MSRRRRAISLAILSVVLGSLAVSDVAGREAALSRRIGPTVPVVVARVDLPVGAALTARTLAVRDGPARFAPAGAYRRPGELRGLKAVAAIPAGTDLTAPLLRDPVAAAAQDAAADNATGLLRPGQRVAEIVARGDARLLAAGSRIDLLVTREGADGDGDTRLALQDAEVLAAAPAPEDDAGGGRHGDGGPRVALSLRVSLSEAVALAAAQNFAKELRVLVRADGDHRRSAPGLRVRDSGGG